jgi:gluconolactonase
VSDVQILAAGLRFPEGPVVLPDGSIWGVELKGGGLFRWRNGDLYRVATGGEPNGLALNDRALWLCDAAAGSIRTLALDAADADATIADAITSSAVRVLDRPNDLAFDRRGNLAFTCPGNSRNEPTGTVWARTWRGDIIVLHPSMQFPNGLAFSPDGRELVVAETYARRLVRGGWDDASCRWVDPRPWIDLPGPVGPDGMAFGANGDLFVAIYGQGVVLRIDPAGTIVETLTTPGANPTNVALDPRGRGLIVTEAERGELLMFGQVAESPALHRHFIP